MDYISGIDNTRTYENPYVSYRMAYPKSYKNNIFLTKFERDHFSSNSLRTAPICRIALSPRNGIDP